MQLYDRWIILSVEIFLIETTCSKNKKPYRLRWYGL